MIYLKTFILGATKSTNFYDFKSHHLNGARNFYVELPNDITLGVWHILPKEYEHSLLESDQFEYLLRNSAYPILIYFHGNAMVRSNRIEMYEIQRNFFHVLAFDYRGKLMSLAYLIYC